MGFYVVQTAAGRRTGRPDAEAVPGNEADWRRGPHLQHGHGHRAQVPAPRVLRRDHDGT